MSYFLDVYLLDEKGVTLKKIGEFDTMRDAEARMNELLLCGFRYKTNQDNIIYTPNAIIKIRIGKKE